MPNNQEIVRTTGSVEGMIRLSVAGFYRRTRSFYCTVSLMAAESGRPREFLLLFPWLVLEHCLRVGVDAVIEFGWVSLKGTRLCVPHIWVVTDDGILDPVMSSMVDDLREAMDLVYHEEVPPGYEHMDGEILTIARYAYEQGLENYIYDEIRCPPDIRAMAIALCNLSHLIAPLGDITL